ncbi:MAG: type II secretion system GspH family protein [Gemmatimonadota bacterium]|nr:type II secretion system GspH family protein [Gemmatimonadota bacterium]
MNEKGFSLIELLVVLTIIAIIANLALPRAHDARTRAQAAAIVADIGVIRQAALAHYAEEDDFPSSGKWGEVPSQMANNLPSGFEFERHGMSYRWRVRKSGGGRRRAGETNVVSVEIRTDNRELLTAVRGLWQGSDWSGNNKTATLIIQ